VTKATGALTALIAAIAFVLLLLLALADMSPAQRQSTTVAFELPAPTGPLPVGTTRWVVTDASRRETFASGDAPRQVPVVAWYPAASSSSRQRAPYFREGLVEIRSFAKLLGQPATAFDELSSVRTHATLDAPPATSPATLPVLIFSHGYTGVASAHAALLEDLASHGFAVLSVNHSYESTGAVLEGGRDVSVLDGTGQMRQEVRDLLGEWKAEDATMADVTRAADLEEQRRLLHAYLGALPRTNLALERWVADTRLVVDGLPVLDGRTPAGHLAARLDAGRTGAFGHSMGGVTAAQFCADDRRCGAALNLDGIPQYGPMIDRPFGKPFMMVYSARPGRVGASDAIYRQAASRFYRADVHDTRHLDFTDMVFWAPLRERQALGTLDPIRAAAITRQLVREFFDQELRGRPSPLLGRSATLAGVEITELSAAR
jgi:predicted dienelactone hydrolase